MESAFNIDAKSILTLYIQAIDTCTMNITLHAGYFDINYMYWKFLSTWLYQTQVSCFSVSVLMFLMAYLQVGWDTLHDEFLKIVEKDKKNKGHDEIFDQLKLAVIEASKNKHQWDSKAEDSLVRTPLLPFPFLKYM